MKDIAQALKFVKGAVAGKDFVPEFTHFRIRDNKVMAFNGRMSLCHPIDLDLDVAPKAKFFERALATVPADTPVSITVTQAGRLSVKADNFRVLVHCHMDIPADFFPQPEGEYQDIEWGLMRIFKDCFPFTAEDASRAWAQSIKLENNSAFATNNSVLVQRWCREENDARPNPLFPAPVVVPKEMVREMLRVGEEPCGVTRGRQSLTFHYANGAWMRSQLIEQPWIDVRKVIDQPLSGLQDVPPNFAADIKRLETFCEDSGIIHIKETTIGTTSVDTEGAVITVEHPLGCCAFHIAVLNKIASVATKIDFRNVPAVFTAPNIRGVAMPIRLSEAPAR